MATSGPFAIALLLLTGWSIAGGSSAADNKYGSGVSDTEIKIGQTMPYSGPAPVSRSTPARPITIR
jgi:branched-chain amino acid transport system substrate-binding protein